MTYWRQAGLTYLQFSTIAARAVRASVKNEFKKTIQDPSAMKQTPWKDGKPIKSTSASS